VDKDIIRLVYFCRLLRASCYDPDLHVGAGTGEVVDRLHALWKKIAASIPADKRQLQLVVFQRHTVGKPVGVLRDRIYVADLPWANNGPSAAAVLDLRQEIGVWLMAFHGEEINTQPLGRWGASIGLAWSEDLENWTVP